MKISDYKIWFKESKENILLLRYAIICVCGTVFESKEDASGKAYKVLLYDAINHAKECKILKDLTSLSFHSKNKKEWIKWIEKYIGKN